MHILVASAQWPSDGKTGLGVIAAKHVEFLAENGYQVSALGISIKFLDDVLIPAQKYYISSHCDISMSSLYPIQFSAFQ